jgi:hypothetical protein
MGEGGGEAVALHKVISRAVIIIYFASSVHEDVTPRGVDLPLQPLLQMGEGGGEAVPRHEVIYPNLTLTLTLTLT